MEFTRQQERAVFERGKDIFVSAGAGAGKTRVLVSRIAELITDPDHPVSPEEILVMTFTNAAAQEMKERIIGELEERLAEDPGNSTLRRQIRLTRQAEISTVHSFCSRLLRRHFQEAEIDPSFRIGEEGEMTLLMHQAMEELLEEAYLEGSSDFLMLVEAFAPGRDDWVLEEMIERLYHFSRGFPDARSWFEARQEELDCQSDPATFEDSLPIRNLISKAEGTVGRLKESGRQLAALTGKELPELSDESGDRPARVPERYHSLLLEYGEIVESLGGLGTYRAYHDFLSGLTLPKLPGGVRKEEKNYIYLAEVKEHLHFVKDTLAEMQGELFAFSPEELCSENARTLPLIREVSRLVLRLEDIFTRMKREQNVYDFDDLEHMTLKLLVQGYDADGEPVPSDTARELSCRYKEIFVDEYQDTSLIQETILKTLHSRGTNFLFVVGDIKQSIYRFRQARPDLFLARLRSGLGVHISLADNFRSAPDVISLCNKVFSKLMDADFGGVDYDEDNALVVGSGGPMEEVEETSEMMLLVEDEEKDDLPIEYDALYAETAMIAKRAKELHEEGFLYSDMVILLRSGVNKAELVAEYLKDWKIRGRCENKKGYFHTREVGVILNYLSVIDNVYQDIPMASVLLSSIGGLDEEDLSRLKTQIEIPMRGEHSLYDLLLLYTVSGEDGELKRKAAAFLDQLALFRRQKKEMPLHQLLWNIYLKTGFYYDVLLMSEGEKRRENLNMLLEKAEDYERTIFKGLFYFIRYIRQLQTYEVEMPEADSIRETDDAIRIMTIHKSKGLEFPVVFVSGLSGQFNLTDTNRSLLCHPVLGMGSEVIDLNLRIHHPSLMKNMIKDRIHKEALEEELRILYVAMTRAQKKLILTGVVTDKMIDRHSKNPLDLYSKSGARCFMDWILPAVVSEKTEGDLAAYVKKIHLHELEFSQVTGNEKEEDFLAGLLSDAGKGDVSPVEKAFSYRYPYAHLTGFKRKYSVSELKKLSMQAPSEEEGADPYGEEYGAIPEENRSGPEGGLLSKTAKGEARAGEKAETEIPVPDFLKEEKTISAADRGTIIHKIMELLPFGKIHTKKELFDALEQIKEEYTLAEQVSMKQVYRGAEQFLFSEEGEKLRRIDRDGKLFKEAPFTISVPQHLVFGNVDNTDNTDNMDNTDNADNTDNMDSIVVQGIIDAYGETEEGLWLIDYKTDRISPGEEQQLLDRYQKQMVYYKTALEMLVKKPVVRIDIFSFALGKFLRLDGQTL